MTCNGVGLQCNVITQSSKVEPNCVIRDVNKDLTFDAEASMKDLRSQSLFQINYDPFEKLFDGSSQNLQRILNVICTKVNQFQDSV